MTVIAYGATLIPPCKPSYKEFNSHIRTVDFPILTVESNYGSQWVPRGVPYLKPEKKKSKDPRRRKQGSGKCFGSGVESRIDVRAWAEQHSPSVHAMLSEVPEKEPYNVRYFPSGGTLQVSGVLMPSLEDGTAAVGLWARYLADQGVIDEPEDGVFLKNEHMNMVNHKFQIRLDYHCPGQQRLILNLKGIKEFLDRASKDPTLMRKGIEDAFEPDPEIAMDELKSVDVVRLLKTKGNTVSFTANIADTHPQIKMFQLYGKINILGAKTFPIARLMYRYIVAWFTVHWEHFVAVLPLDDDELEEMAKKAKAKAERKAKKEAKAAKKATEVAREPAVAPAPAVFPEVSRVIEVDLDDLLHDIMESLNL
jgi:hypothetical protein